MSLETYKKSIRNQQDRDGLYSSSVNSESYDSIPEVLLENDAYQTKSKKTVIGKLILTLIFISVFLLAAIKNPNKTEAKAEIMTMLMEQINETIKESSGSQSSKFGAYLTMAFMGNTLAEAFLNTEISDYIFFSTYDVKTNVHEEEKIIVSGIIIFGKILPLHSDLDDFK